MMCVMDVCITHNETDKGGKYGGLKRICVIIELLTMCIR